MKKLYLFAFPGLATAAVVVACTGRVEIGSGDPSPDDAGTVPEPTDAMPIPEPTDASPIPEPVDAMPIPQPTDASVPDARPTPTDAGRFEPAVNVLVHHDRRPLASPSWITSTLVSSGGEKDPDPACTTTTIGACTLQAKRCTVVPGTATFVGNPKTLNFTGAAFPSPMNLTVIVPGGPAQFGSSAAWWTTGGDTVDVSAAATSDSPAFAVRIATPSDISVTLPANASATNALTVPFTVVGAASGEVGIEIQPSGGAGPYATCTAQASAGAVTIPAAVMSALGRGSLLAVVRSASHASTFSSGTKIVVALTEAVTMGDIVVP